MPSLPAATTMGAVTLVVCDLDRMREFYERVVGLQLVGCGAADGRVEMGVEGGPPLVVLVGGPDAPAAPAGTTGLFHLALLVVDRLQLARAIRRVGEAGWRFTGASDHLVSEAMYLNDPEGNGIELYRDRPRSEWNWDGDQVAMGTIALDIDAVMDELPAGQDSDGPMTPGTVMGHVHLRVSDIAAAEAFYAGLLGFNVTVKGYSGALFMSAGGYHHHVGVNTWASAGATAPPEGAGGLDHFEVIVPGTGDVEDVAARLRGAGVAIQEDELGMSTTDPAGNRVWVRTPAALDGPK